MPTKSPKNITISDPSVVRMGLAAEIKDAKEQVTRINRVQHQLASLFCVAAGPW